jgi:hypothetical protein
MPFLFLSARLHTQVTRDGIRARFRPFHLRYRTWDFNDIHEIHPRRYAPIAEYGGWGIRWGPAGWAYNVSGDQGIQLVLHSGKRILLGTRQPHDFIAAVERALAGRTP